MKYYIQRISKIMLLVLFVSVPFQSHANDWASFQKMITYLSKIYGVQENNLPRMLEQAKETVTQLDEINKNLSGHFGYGNLYNSDDYLKQYHQWSNASWGDLLKGLEAGNSELFRKAQEDYTKLFPVIEKSAIKPTVKNELSRNYYEQSRQVSRSALAVSKTSYDLIAHHMEILQELLKKLETEPSEKATLDLNARLMGEVGFIQLEMLKLQTMQTQLQATTTQGEVNGMSDEATFMQWDPK